MLLGLRPRRLPGGHHRSRTPRPAALWGGLAGATLLSAAVAAVATEKGQGTQPKDSGAGPSGSSASTTGALSASS
ncbi:hypothetical protein FBY34_2709 [Streptomyces sp. SLBN-115]|nr:hypothetical protein FBY34_2709 [Streptomyces sp. SLBN-115]